MSELPSEVEEPSRLAVVAAAAAHGAAAADDAPASPVLRAAVAHDLAQRAALSAALHGLTAAGVRCLVVKGTALSPLYAHQLRPRNDDDVLVQAGDVTCAGQVLEALGYRRASQLTAVVITGQQLFSRRVFGITHHLDLHTRLLNPVAFATLPDFACLWEASESLSGCPADARAPCPAHALLCACAHRVAHHTPTEDPLWLLDLHRLARALDDSGWRRFVCEAQRARMAELCASELSRAAMQHGTVLPAFVRRELRAAEREPSARHLAAHGRLHVLWLDLRHAPSWRSRRALVTAQLLPPAEYMRARFGARSLVGLACSYATRVTRGSLAWLGELIVRAAR